MNEALGILLLAQGAPARNSVSATVSAALLVIGGAFMLLAGMGVVRMPDLFMRMQAATKAATLGVGCMLLAVAVHFGQLAITARCLLVTAFVFLTAPVAAHVIARAAYSVGVPLWEGTFRDELREAREALAGEGSPVRGDEVRPSGPDAANG